MQHTMPLVSVIVPVYRMEAYLDSCVESIVNQSYSNLEILLIDDGSPDASGAMCDDWARRDARIRVIHQKNQGLSAVRNVGVQAASGAYIAFVDADDWVDSRYIEVLYTACETYSVPLSCCNHWICQANSRRLRFSKPRETLLLDAHEACANILYHGIPDVSAWGKLIRRDMLMPIHYPEGKIYEDTYVIAELLNRAEKLVFVPDPLYFYRIRSDSLSRDRFTPSKLDFIDSVAHMTDTIERLYPGEMTEGILRRKMHALLSVRRYFVDCPPEQTALRDQLEDAVKRDAPAVLKQKKLPFRDRIAIHSVQLGPRWYDVLWKALKK